MSRRLSLVGPVESVGGTPTLRLPRTTETAALEACVPARVSEERILIPLPDETSFPVGTTVEVYQKRGGLVIRRYGPRNDSRTGRAMAASNPTVAWHAISPPRRWTFGLGSFGFEVTVASRVDNP